MPNLLAFVPSSSSMMPFGDSVSDIQMPMRYGGVVAQPASSSNWGFFGFMLTLLVFSLLLGFIFVLVKSVYLDADKAVKTEYVRRCYLYVMSFVSMGVIFLAFSDLIRVIFNSQRESLSVSYYYNYGPEYTAGLIAFRAAIVTVALPVFLFHWLRVSTKVNDYSGDAKTTALKERKWYANFVMFLYAIPGLFFGASLVYRLFLLVLSPASVSLSDFAFPFSYTFSVVAILLFHFKVAKDAESKLKN